MRDEAVEREYPKVPLLGVGALVLRDGKILLVRRGAPPNKGKWSIPGGMPKVGESVYEAALRELEEEAGITGTPRGVACVAEYVETSDGRVRYHYVIVDVLVEASGSEPKAGGDALQAGFFDLEEALKLDLTESTRRLIEILRREGVRTLPLISVTASKAR